MKHILLCVLLLIPFVCSWGEESSRGELVSELGFLQRGEYYGGFEAGYSYSFSPNKNVFRDETTEDSAQIGVVLGKNLGCNIRLELEAGYKTKSTAKNPPSAYIKEQTFESTIGMVNIYKSWDFRRKQNIQPFVMGGIGIAYNKAGDFKTFETDGTLNSTVLGKKNKDIAYQFGVGISLEINKDSHLDFSTRYVYRGKADTSGSRVVSGVESSYPAEKAEIKDILGLVTLRLNL